MEHDFGTILSNGQELRHTFRLKNPTDRPIALRNQIAYKPCCSAITSLPKSILPRGEAEVSLALNSRGQSGPGYVKFTVEGDRPGLGWVFILKSTILPDWEVRPIGESSTSTPVGRPARQTWRAIARRHGIQGLGLPSAVHAASPLSAAFDAPSVDTILPGGVVESSRPLTITIPAVRDPGTFIRALTFSWPDPIAPRTREMTWRVTPLVEVSPIGIVLSDPGLQSRDVLIRSADRPVRVLRIDNPLSPVPPSYPSSPSSVHKLTLPFDPSLADSRGMADVSILTDHPDQPRVSLTVMAIPPKSGGQR